MGSLVTIMYKITFAVCLSAVAALPLEDTAEVKAAKEAFATEHKTGDVGDHINLRPVNNDVQAPQIANAYLDDTMEVAEAKEAFMAAFRNVEDGGLAAMQAPAPKAAEPVQISAPVAPVAVYSALPTHHTAYNNFAYNHLVPATYAVNPKVAVPATYAHVPATYAVPNTYAYGYPAYAHGFPYVMPAVQAAEKVETEAVEMA